jgi:hypothetical protein
MPTAPDPHCERVRAAALTLSFRHRGQTLSWAFGPHREGRWSMVMDGGRQAFAVPRADGFHLPGVRALPLQVRYDSPDGWRTYSPVLALDFDRAPDLSFTR